MIVPPLKWDGHIQNKLSFLPFVPKVNEYSKHPGNQKKCLEIFMEEYKQIFSSLQLSNVSFHDLLSCIWHLYEQHECQNLCQDFHAYSGTRIVEKFDEVSF